MFKGTVVLGNIIKLLSGKTGIFFGSSSFFIFQKNILYLIFNLLIIHKLIIKLNNEFKKYLKRSNLI